MSNFQQTSLPLRRTDAVTVQQVGDEMLIYDERTHQAYCLNATVALVWNHCDGHHTLEQLVSLVSPQGNRLAAEAVVRSALSQLAKDALITGGMPDALPVISRRAMLAQGGAGLALLLPVIAVIAAPEAAQLQLFCSRGLRATSPHGCRAGAHQPLKTGVGRNRSSALSGYPATCTVRVSRRYPRQSSAISR